MQLHAVQKKLLELLKKNIYEPLTMQQLKDELDLSSTSVVYHHILRLEKKGYLRRNPNNPRDYQILGDPEKSITYINLYGLAQCGPKGSVLDGNPIDKLPIASRILGFKSSDAFIVKARGDSMSPKIHDADLVITKKCNYANNGDIVVCVNKGEALIKKLEKIGEKILLISLNNEKYPPFIADEDDFRIEGIVRSIISYKI